MIKFDFNSYMNKYVTKSEIDEYLLRKETTIEKLRQAEMAGWLDIDYSSVEDINKTANYIKSNCDVLVVIGIGGSFMSSKAIIEAFKPYFEKEPFEIIYAGNNLSGKYMKELLDYLNNKNFMINVISKSGGTLETRIAYNKLYDLLDDKYDSEELKRRIFITTNEVNSPLLEDAKENGFKYFLIPNNIGGRYSVFTPAGLLPMATYGIDIKELLDGAKKMTEAYDLAYKYASIRNIMFKKKKHVENFVIYEPCLYYFTLWIEQLFGETEGKDNKGILPISTINSRDLHSLGQFLQEGKDIIFETVICFNNEYNINVNHEYTMDKINSILISSVANAHNLEHTPSILINLDKLDYETIGSLMYFLMLTASLSGYLFNVNPFNQPGVEKYKAGIKDLLK